VTWDEIWLFLHFMGMIVWLGGAIAVQVFGVLTTRSGEPARSAAFGRDAGWVVRRVFLPASVVVLVSGIGLVQSRDWDWGEPFVWLGLVLWIAVSAVAFGVISPRLARTGAQIAAEGPTPELLAAMKRLILSARVLVAVLVFVVFLMTVKPGT
jgi:uncharacterized membrane protein